MFNHSHSKLIEKCLTRFDYKYLFFVVFCLCTTQVLLCGQKIVIDDADLNRFNSAKNDLLARQQALVFSSDMRDYLDGDGYRSLLMLDDKIIPFLLREIVQLENKKFLTGDRGGREQQSIHRFICLAILAKTTSGKAAQRTGYDGSEETYEWVRWWKKNKNKYAMTFKGAESFDIGNYDYEDIRLPSVR